MSTMFRVLVPAHIDPNPHAWTRQKCPLWCSLNKKTIEKCVAVMEILRVPEESRRHQKHPAIRQYLVAFNLSGSVLFVSKGFSATNRPEWIWAQSGFLDYLELGDLVLTDGGSSLYVAIPASDVRLQRKRKMHDPTCNPNGELQKFPAKEDVQMSYMGNDRLGLYRTYHFNITHINKFVAQCAFESLRRRFAVLRDGFDSHISAHPVSMDQVVAVCCALHNASSSRAH